MTNDSCFQTMDGNPVKIHGFPMKMLPPRPIARYWDWACICITKIVLVTAKFDSHHTPDTSCDRIYGTRVIIESGTPSNASVFKLLERCFKADSEADSAVPRFCLCSAHKETLTNEDGQRYYKDWCPFQIQFIDKSHEELIQRYIDETMDCISKGVSIRSQSIDDSPYDAEYFEFSSTPSFSLTYPAAYFSPELRPIINNWKSFFFSIKNEVGVLPQPSSSVISHWDSPAELYNEITAKTHCACPVAPRSP